MGASLTGNKSNQGLWRSVKNLLLEHNQVLLLHIRGLRQNSWQLFFSLKIPDRLENDTYTDERTSDVGGAEYHHRQHLPHHVAHHWLTHVIVDTFLPTMLLDGMVGVAPSNVRYGKLAFVKKGLRKERSKERKRLVTKQATGMCYVAVFVENSS
ncbi:hypothetical protein TNCV_1029781 [Trichonephila clavipes]|nr:hypothetical protein TNCV_1029781 [Trichonephila clavipes]